MQKNQKIEVKIFDMSDQGYGVAKVDGRILFVREALLDEVILAKVISIKKTFAIAIIEEIIEPSKERVQSESCLGTITGITPLEHMSYQAQLDFKESQVYKEITKRVDQESIEFLPIIGMKDPWRYRNKAQIPVQEVDGQLETGFYRRRSHDLIPLDNYFIQDPLIDVSINLIRDLLRNHDIEPYDEATQQGLIRHIIVRQAQHSLDQMIILVWNTDDSIPKELVSEIIETVPNLVSLIQNINTQDTNVIMGKENRVLFGHDYYKDKLFDLEFKISSQSFFQVNSDQTEVLYQTALNMIDFKDTDTIIDAYSGIGTISLFLAKKAKKVIGVEIVSDAVRMAKENAKINNIDNVEFIHDQAERFIPNYVKNESLDVLVVDPPRKGLHKDFTEAVLEAEPRTIVYISCNPKTLARDLERLSESYNIKKVQPVDMFPQTLHIESVVLLQKKD